ncbi:MAG: pyridoxal phosphate-dependent aminotransferase family protein [Bacteroidetes bacterium]|nr:pyridoxal phosphate-dependent aminotransferase family protein [Bacteroidota bacterium]
MSKNKFEDYLKTDGGNDDIFKKIYEVEKYFKTNINEGEQGLGFQLLESANNRVNIKDRKGNIRKSIMLGSNSYLNLTSHPRVVKASIEAIQKYGYGMGAVSLYAGITDLHRELEELISKFLGTEDTILFPSGYGTNIGVISAICRKDDVIINDSANHASIFDGCLVSGAKIKIYPHNKINLLEHVLSKLPNEQKGRLIITDGVFSMHGDLAPLDQIVVLAEKYKARLMVDDAHGLGVVGPTGRGTAEEFGVQDKVDLNVGMLSKSPGGLGGYCSGKKNIIDFLRLYSRTYFFSTAMPASIIAGLIEVFKMFLEDKAGRKKLWDNINYLKSNLNKLGFHTGEAKSGIIPIIVGDEEKLINFHKDLREAGLYTNIVSYPAVRRKECRLRLCAMSSLTISDMNEAISILKKFGQKYDLY